MSLYDTEELTPPQNTDENTNFLPPLEPPPPGTIRHIDIHVYDQPAEEEETPAEIDGTITPESYGSQEPQPAPQQEPPEPR